MICVYDCVSVCMRVYYVSVAMYVCMHAEVEEWYAVLPICSCMYTCINPVPHKHNIIG